jgi:hypothetical protein
MIPYEIKYFDGPGEGRKTAFKVYKTGQQLYATPEEVQMFDYALKLSTEIVALEGQIQRLTEVPKPAESPKPAAKSGR